MREDEKLQKAGVLKHVKEIISKVFQISQNFGQIFADFEIIECVFQIRTVSDKLGNILEYHQVNNHVV